MDVNNDIDATENKDFSNLNTIGVLLQAARKNRNEDLSDVAKKLRIRQVYLEAIENDQFKILPGDIYVVGFIKSYSKHLGLDSEEIIKRYKSEAGKLKTENELKFPAYVPENGIPGGSILLLGLVVTIIGYSGWYFFSVRNSFDTTQVARVPTSLVKDKPAISILPEKEKITPQNNENNTDVTRKDSIEDLSNKKNLAKDDDSKILSEQTDKKKSAPNTQERVLGEIAARIDKPEPIDTPSTIQKKSMPKINMPQKLEFKSDSAISKEPSTKLNLEAEAEKKLELSLNSDNETKKTSEVIVTSNNKPSIKVPLEPSRKIQPAPNSSVRIIIEARADSYIQVRDNNANQLLITRLLREGQRYEVPNRAGLTLLTGNAGALKILVDGIVVPGIGPIGAIRRNVVLDAIKLKNGLAIIE